MLRGPKLPAHEIRAVDVEHDLAACDDRLSPPEPGTHFDLDAELFSNLPRQRRLRRFPGLDLAAGKLPRARQRHPRTALRNETLPLANNRGTDDLNDRRLRQGTRLAETLVSKQ